jgi:phospholipid/cholesterol/gamma-HCH transport system substrate-binding protein
VTNLTPVLEDLAGQGDELRGTVRELDRLMTGLARNRHHLGRSLDSAIDLVGTVSSLVREVRPALVRDVRSFRAVVAMYAGQGELFGRSLEAFAEVLGRLGRTLSYRSALNAYFCVLNMTVNGIEVGTGTLPQRHTEVCR